MKLQRIEYKNGVRLAYAEYGDSQGFPILIQHGLIASIKDYPLFQPLLDLGARLICIARPGYGDSSPYEMENLAEWGRMAATLVDHLNLLQFDVLGISSGAPYSYAIGYTAPEKVRNIFILSGTPALYDDRVLAYWPYPIKKDADITEMQKLAHELFFSSLSRANLEKDDIKDSMVNDCFGVAQDLRIRCLDWGFKACEVKPNVIMRHSRSDDSVPFVTAEITSQLLANCKLEFREKDAHFSKEVLDDFIKSRMAECYPKKSVFHASAR